MDASRWPGDERALEAEQRRLARLAEGAEPWIRADLVTCIVGGVFLTVPTGEAGREAAPGDPVWAAAAVLRGASILDAEVARGRVTHPYRAGYLALQCGPLLEQAVRGLATIPDVLLVNATGRDHPRGAGLAMHLGAVLDLPTVGVTDRPLTASGPEPGAARWSAAPMALHHRVVAFALRSRRGTHPIVVHAAWRTSPETALEVARAACLGARTPEPLRQARRLAREARARDERRLP